MVEIITIDGPASVGKSTLAKRISSHYKSPLLNSGRLYRAIALKMKIKKIRINDRTEIIKIARLLSDNDMRSNNLFNSGIEKIASQISAREYLRDELKVYQREFPKKYQKKDLR